MVFQIDADSIAPSADHVYGVSVIRISWKRDKNP